MKSIIKIEEKINNLMERRLVLLDKRDKLLNSDDIEIKKQRITIERDIMILDSYINALEWCIIDF